ncbi:MAG: MFS transporter [Prolixibacteraceae bacterium]|jgi:MFS family permease|nr:MFS transporter [Prolixibacteraceae bacterium]MBT6005976.1 MFS transporter [Prolixibacteraceae bacterium]MBT6766683.1 MFS transporter [Prolixibacteraceae bacterium]MBT6997242.1 MFS transporter [Prolixibacteraceae bacterium]MBT7396876.1 MFS transporter [Prolixibacteraceae bacterium]
MDAIKKTLRESPAMRWFALLLISGLTFSTYWFQDFFGGIKPLMESEMGFTSEEFGRLIGLTTIANMFGMIIIGGMILDKWGIRVAGLLFGGLAVIGGAISAMASTGFFGEEHSTMLNYMILGRVFFGVGLEVVCVVATRTVVKWFKGYELALAMAINMGFGRLGSALGIAVSPDLAVNSVPPAVVFAATLIGVALIMFVIYLIFDVKLDKQTKGANVDGEEEEEFKFSDLFKLLKNKSFLYIALLCVAFYAAVFPFIQYAADLLINKFGFTSTLSTEGVITLFGSTALGTSSVYIGLFIFALSITLIPAQIKAKNMKTIALVIILALFFIFIYSLKDVLSVWLKNGPKTASLIPLGTILFTPIFGSYVDRKGKAASLMMLGSLLLIFAHLSLSVFNSVFLGYAGLLSLGVAFSLVPAAMWPSVAKIVPESRLGTAYATMFTIQNWGLGLFFWGIGAVLDLTNKGNLEAIRAGNDVYDYTIPILMLVVCGVISIFLSYKLKQADKIQGFGLELPSGQKPE